MKKWWFSHRGKARRIVNWLFKWIKTVIIIIIIQFLAATRLIIDSHFIETKLNEKIIASNDKSSST